MRNVTACSFSSNHLCRIDENGVLLPYWNSAAARARARTRFMEKPYVSIYCRQRKNDGSLTYRMHVCRCATKADRCRDTPPSLPTQPSESQLSAVILEQDLRRQASLGVVPSYVNVTRLAHRRSNGGFNLNIERESHGCANIAFYSTIFIGVDILRQVTGYGLKYFNNDVYPIPQTFLVFFCEFAKLLVFFSRLAWSRSLRDVSLSFRYLVPSTLYAINNNIYFLALYYTTPPMWNILMQGRIICTALVYRGVFKKTFSGVQWLALFIMMIAIVLTQFSHAESTGSATDGSNLLYLLKNDRRSFDDKQLQLYMFGAIVTGLIGVCQVYLIGGDEENSFSYYAGLTVIFAVCGGITTAFIMKKLDNIVKLYTQSMSTIMTTIVCVAVFPRRFHFDVIFVVCLVLNVIAIFMYENNDCTFVTRHVLAWSHRIRQSNVESKWYIVTAKYFFSFLIIVLTSVLLVFVILQDYFGIFVLN
ncbi:hypothetical protein LSH36_575g02051 [Paralvinella palmiformis]|uniref:Uncharacterized protein n=1 Tax=Paralvinella palmiformis TaxID=53620 RepID=A0AAD9J6D6_9ANNE|nr:hypothetical protein LSH36_575g02051 [Paralvinella palmiformis]